MTFTIWTTGHQINETICEAIAQGTGFKKRHVSEYDGKPVPSISYGILRGTTPIFHDCEKANIPWWHIDRGYWGANHYDGYYRLTYRRLQAKFNHQKTDSARWESYNLKISLVNITRGAQVLICPPTEAICEFYGINSAEWLEDAVSWYNHAGTPYLIRDKTCPRSLEDDLANCHEVYTFNSTVVYKAMMKGKDAHGSSALAIPESAYLVTDLFCFLANNQFTLEEFRNGEAWKIANKNQLIPASI